MLKNPVFFNAEWKISYQQFLIFLNFIKTFFKKAKNLLQKQPPEVFYEKRCLTVVQIF